MIYKWAEPPDPAAGSGAVNPLDRIDALQKCSCAGPRVVQWICQRAGGFFIKNPRRPIHPHPEFLIPATNEIIQEFADLLGVIANAVADNQITESEAADIPRTVGGVEVRDGGFCAMLRAGQFPAFEKARGFRVKPAHSSGPTASRTLMTGRRRPGCIPDLAGYFMLKVNTKNIAEVTSAIRN